MPATIEVIGGGRRLRQARKRANLSQTQLAEIIGVSQNTISAWERGEWEPTLRQCDAIAIALNLNWQTPRLWWEPTETNPTDGPHVTHAFWETAPVLQLHAA